MRRLIRDIIDETYQLLLLFEPLDIVEILIGAIIGITIGYFSFR